MCSSNFTSLKSVDEGSNGQEENEEQTPPSESEEDSEMSSEEDEQNPDELMREAETRDSTSVYKELIGRARSALNR